MFRLVLWIAILGLVSGLLIQALRLALRRWKTATRDPVIDDLRRAIDESGLTESQKIRLWHSYLPRLADYRRLAQRSNRRWKALNKTAITSPYLAGGVALATTTLLQSHWMWGMLVGAGLAGAGSLARAWDGVEGNAVRRLDAWELADAMEDALNALLSENLEVPISERWMAFCKEIDAIRNREHELFSRYTTTTQQVADREYSEARKALEDARHDRRSLSQSSPPPPPPAIRPDATDHPQESTRPLAPASPVNPPDDELLPSEALR